MTCDRCGTDWPDPIRMCPRCLLGGRADVDLGPGLLVEEEIGRGGMGVVYRARHVGLDRTVAVKVLDTADDPSFRERFHREARLLAAIDHPHVVRVHDVGLEAGRAWLVMEHVEGGTLADALPLPAPEAMARVLEVATALSALHALGIVHRDVKPQNVLLTGDGTAKLSDFGIARLLPEPALTRSGLVAGTPAYLAPEVLSGAVPHARQDVYALGVLLCEVATGQPGTQGLGNLPPPLRRVARAALAPASERPIDAGALLPMLRAAAAEVAQRAPLPADEGHWLSAVALLCTVATAAALWTLVASLTPRVIDERDLQPLVMVRGERLADGRFVSRARFETGPTLMAAALAGLALASWALLRRHWRTEGLDAPAPDQAVGESRVVLGLGVAAVAVWALRLTLQARGHVTPPAYVPLLGGLAELAILFLVWRGVLSAWRVGRPLVREPLLFAGFALALVPPVSDFARWLSLWEP